MPRVFVNALLPFKSRSANERSREYQAQSKSSALFRVKPATLFERPLRKGWRWDEMRREEEGYEDWKNEDWRAVSLRFDERAHAGPFLFPKVELGSSFERARRKWIRATARSREAEGVGRPDFWYSLSLERERERKREKNKRHRLGSKYRETERSVSKRVAKAERSWRIPSSRFYDPYATTTATLMQMSMRLTIGSIVSRARPSRNRIDRKD